MKRSNDEALGQQQEAIHSYEEATRLNRENLTAASFWPPLNLGALMLKLDRLNEAETYLRESLKYDPKSPKTRYRLALLFEKQGKLEDAVSQLKESAATDASYPEPHYALNRIYRSKDSFRMPRPRSKHFRN